jgi:uncharacterized protein (TIGR01777 family)
MPVGAAELYTWHSRPLAFQRLQPPWEEVKLISTTGSFGTDGQRIEFQTRLFGLIKSTWLAEAYDFQPGKGFQDRQLKGPFAYWNHAHRFIPDGEKASFLEDHIEYRLPLGLVGRFLGSRMTRRHLQALFNYRHAVTASDLHRHAQFREQPRQTIAITGSRGLIGSALVPFLTTGGHRVVRLVTGSAQRTGDDGTTWLNWDPTAPLAPQMLEDVDAVIHLAGDNVASGRWTDRKKRQILDSRIIPTEQIARAIAEMPAHRRPRVFLSASAVGYYGNRGDERLTEDADSGTGFFPEVARRWEAATLLARDCGVRTVHLRIGVVLTPRGGALGKQLFAFKMGAGAVLGNGRQWVPWITIGDLVGAIYHCLMSSSLSGPINVVGPHPVTNYEFTKTLGNVLRRPAFLWLPRSVLRLMFGELADEALLASVNVIPKKLVDSGFRFDHSDLQTALRFVLGR